MTPELAARMNDLAGCLTDDNREPETPLEMLYVTGLLHCQTHQCPNPIDAGYVVSGIYGVVDGLEMCPSLIIIERIMQKLLDDDS